jgi:glycosyltransferase involved in cell wall biosynthesis
MTDTLPRIAMVTPLPPELTGIADYVAMLLPALRTHFEIDLYTTAAIDGKLELGGYGFPVFPWQQLTANRDNYVEVVYQFGNSPFHSHMVELLDKVPGIVVLHDFFLSSMLAHMDLHEGHAGLFKQELARSHGEEATTKLALYGHWEAAKDFPASRRVIERAKSVIVHSGHSGHLRDQYFPELTQVSWNVVPMPQLPVPNRNPVERDALRARLGFSSKEFIVVSLGFLADTKLNHVLLEAVQEQELAAQASIRVVFVGENDGGEYGASLTSEIERMDLPGRVAITGFVDSKTYEDYLCIADCAVQLRTRSRGETSKAVHDCMSHGLPVIVNDYASFGQLPDATVYKISAMPTAGELARALADLIGDPLKPALIGLFAKHHMYKEHSAERVAAGYAEVIRQRNGIAGIASRPSTSGIASDGCVGQPHAVPRQLLVDLSEVVRVDYGTGIHRVVRNLTRELVSMGEAAGWSCIPVFHSLEGAIQSADGYVRDVLGVTPHRQELGFSAGDRLFLLDSVWEHAERFSGTIARLHEVGGQAGVMLYDLIPLRYPGYCVDYMPAIFERWLRFALGTCDFIICISRSVADDLLAWIQENAPQVGRALRIGHVHLGSDVGEGRAPGRPSAAMESVMEGGASILMVGTVEPRKRHDLALDAFEAIWAEGSSKRLVIVGKQGWNVEAITERLKQHPELGRRLFWLEHAADADLEHAYRTCSCLLQASDAEGFGLPIIEAARHGRALVLSDIAVFREIAGGGAAYFTPGDVLSLIEALEAAPHSVVPVASLSWRQSALRLLQLIDADTVWDHHVVPSVQGVDGQAPSRT